MKTLMIVFKDPTAVTHAGIMRFCMQLGVRSKFRLVLIDHPATQKGD
jgi:hypothetical protein